MSDETYFQHTRPTKVENHTHASTTSFIVPSQQKKGKVEETQVQLICNGLKTEGAWAMSKKANVAPMLATTHNHRSPDYGNTNHNTYKTVDGAYSEGKMAQSPMSAYRKL